MCVCVTGAKQTQLFYCVPHSMGKSITLGYTGIGICRRLALCVDKIAGTEKL